MRRISLLIVLLAASLAAQTSITITVPTPKQLIETIPVSLDPAVTLQNHALPKTPMKDTVLLVLYRDRLVGVFAPAGPDTKALVITLPESRRAGDAVKVIYWTME